LILGPGHAAAAPNCSAGSAIHVPPVGHFNSACGGSGLHDTIDATPPHAEVNADVGFSAGSPATADRHSGQRRHHSGTARATTEPTRRSPPAHELPVHTNVGLGNGIGGDILVQSKFSNVSTFSFAFQANDTPTAAMAAR
jgi:hypothetical protein